MTKKSFLRNAHSSGWAKKLTDGAQSFNLHLNENTVALFERYLQELLRWNERINITAVRTPEDIAVKHFLDSLSIVPYLPEKGRMADIGSGGGFPGIPVKIVQPSLHLTLIEASRKKANFLRHIARTLALRGIAIWEGRIESMSGEEPFDCVTGRAVADLKKFLKIAAPLVKDQGVIVAMKGRNIAGELRAAEEELVNSRLKLIAEKIFPLPYRGGTRTILLFKKCFT
jgi:16S rRNA (guanine527-N7)-methyltransferase